VLRPLRKAGARRLVLLPLFGLTTPRGCATRLFAVGPPGEGPGQAPTGPFRDPGAGVTTTAATMSQVDRQAPARLAPARVLAHLPLSHPPVNPRCRTAEAISMSDGLVRIKRAVLAGRFAFSVRARIEMEADGLTESIINAGAI
jgi:hypothetical protein